MSFLIRLMNVDLVIVILCYAKLLKVTIVVKT